MLQHGDQIAHPNTATKNECLSALLVLRTTLEKTARGARFTRHETAGTRCYSKRDERHERVGMNCDRAIYEELDELSLRLPKLTSPILPPALICY